jgi:hypothetical protein
VESLVESVDTAAEVLRLSKSLQNSLQLFDTFLSLILSAVNVTKQWQPNKQEQTFHAGAMNAIVTAAICILVELAFVFRNPHDRPVTGLQQHSHSREDPRFKRIFIVYLFFSTCGKPKTW